MQKSEAILGSMEMVKQASVASLGAKALSFGKKILLIGSTARYVGNQWNKLPGVARYGIGGATTLAFPTMMYMGGKSEAEDHVANKAYEDAYNLTQQRIGEEWSKMPAWQRYATSVLGVENAMAMKNLFNESKNAPLTYSSVDATGNKTYY
jgi:hypothetical protein